MVCTKFHGKIHGNGEKRRIATSLGLLGGRHLKQVRVESGEKGKAGKSRRKEWNILAVRRRRRVVGGN